jgi:phosphotransferase family enzyme
MGELGFPKDPAELDAAWFTTALRSTATIGDDTEVASVRSEQIGQGVGILALLWRVHLTYGRGSGPATAVLKLPHTFPESRHIADSFRFYEREVRFYEQAAARTPLRTPARYASAFDDDEGGSGDFLLLMEDLAGRTVHDQLSGCPGDDAERDLQALALHHATWWDSPELRSMPWAVRVADPPNPQALVPALRQSWPIIESQFSHLLRGPMLKAAERLPDVVVPLMERLSEPPVTLLHGDHRLDNLFFSDHDVAALDWQITGTGRGPYDVAYFLSQSLVPELRKEVEHDLVRAYHDTLVGSGVTGYSFEACWEDYRLATLFVSVYPLNAGAVDLVNDRAVELFSAMLDRSVSAILELDALELMPS